MRSPKLCITLKTPREKSVRKSFFRVWKWEPQETQMAAKRAAIIKCGCSRNIKTEICIYTAIPERDFYENFKRALGISY